MRWGASDWLTLAFWLLVLVLLPALFDVPMCRGGLGTISDATNRWSERWPVRVLFGLIFLGLWLHVSFGWLAVGKR